MKIPSSINPNTLKAYELVKGILEDEDQVLQSFNFAWDNKVPKNLQDLCIETIAKNWEENPILEEIELPYDRFRLIDTLSLDLPLSLTIPRISDDLYWKKCFERRWSNRLPRNVKNIEMNEVMKPNNVRKCSIISLKSNGTNNSTAGSVKGVNPEKYRRNSKQSLKKHSNDNNGSLKTWKEYFIEMYIKDYFEQLKPEEYQPEELKELSDLCSPYMTVLIMNEMKSSENRTSRIPLNSVLAGFHNLKEVDLCFKQTYLVDNFSWGALNTSSQDINLLVKGLDKLRLQILRITNSDINCDKVILILKALLKHALRVMDFSHCKIGNRGILAIARFALEVPVEEVFLSNNRFGYKGAAGLAYTFTQPACKMTKMDINLNGILDQGADILFQSLTTRGKSLKCLSVAGCGITNTDMLSKMLAVNETLEELDICNNNMSEEGGKRILEAVQHNKTLKKFDVRITRIDFKIELQIQNLIYENKKNQRRDVKSLRKIAEEFKVDAEVLNEMENMFQ